MPDIALTTGKARKNNRNNSHHIFHRDEGRVNEKMLVKHFKLLCRRTLYKYRAILLVILMGWGFLLLKKIPCLNYAGLALLYIPCFTAQQRDLKLWTFYYLWILGMWPSQGGALHLEFQRDNLILNGFWIPWLWVSVLRDVLFIITTYKRKSQ